MIKAHIMPYSTVAGKYACSNTVASFTCPIDNSNQHNKKLIIRFEETT